MELLPIFGASVAAGLASAPHCAAMCGPLALAACGNRAAPTAAYTFGRLVSYALGGAVAGAVGGRLVMVLGRSHVHHVAAGITALAVAWQALRLLRAETRAAPLVPLRASREGSVRRGLGIGLLTGLLPCGALAAALLLAAGTASPGGGALAMIAYAMASAPGLLAVVAAGRFASRFGLRAPARWQRRALGLALLGLAAWTLSRPFTVARRGCHCHDRATLTTNVVRSSG
jgi:sulfite exporter TauE/SafE